MEKSPQLQSVKKEIWIRKLRDLTIIAMIIIKILTSGCSTKELARKNTFCKTYGASSFIHWRIEAKPIKDGVADSLSGFQCKYIAANKNEKVNTEDECISNEDNKLECLSKKYELKELCLTGEIGIFLGKEYEQLICK